MIMSNGFVLELLLLVELVLLLLGVLLELEVASEEDSA